MDRKTGGRKRSQPINLLERLAAMDFAHRLAAAANNAA